MECETVVGLATIGVSKSQGFNCFKIVLSHYFQPEHFKTYLTDVDFSCVLSRSPE